MAIRTATITIRSLADLDPGPVIRALNAAYADYYVPIYLTPESFRTLVEREAVRLDASAAALHNGEVIGLGLLGVRGQRGWVGGVGVIPAYRRQGAARQIMDHLIDQAHRLGLTRLQLEVIIRNQAAYVLYETLGFRIERQLLVLAHNGGSDTAPGDPLLSELTIGPEPPADLLAALPELNACPRPWQRQESPDSPTLPHLCGLAARRRADNRLLGVCLAAGNNHHKNLIDLAAVSGAVGQALIASLFERHPLASFSYLNVAEDDPMLPVLLQAGFQETLRQFEMFLYLDQEPAFDR